MMSNDSQYQTGHGRDKCRHDICSSNWEVPANCGFAADQWEFPETSDRAVYDVKEDSADVSIITIVVNFISNVLI